MKLFSKRETDTLADLESGLKAADLKLEKLQTLKEKALAAYLEAEENGSSSLPEDRQRLAELGMDIDICQKSIRVYIEKIENFHQKAVEDETSRHQEVAAESRAELVAAARQAGAAIGLAQRIFKDTGWGSLYEKINGVIHPKSDGHQVVLETPEGLAGAFLEGVVEAFNSNDFSALMQRKQSAAAAGVLARNPNLQMNQVILRCAKSTGRKPTKPLKG